MGKYFWIKLRIFWMTLEWGARIGFAILVFVLIFSITSSVYQFLNPKIVEIEKWETLPESDYDKKEVSRLIKVIKDKDRLIAKLKIPAPMVQDKEILTETTIKPSEGGTDIIATLDQEGKTDIITREHPRPFISLKPKGYIGVDFSPIHSSTLGDWRLTGEYEAGRIWNIKPFVRGEIDQKGIYRISGGLKYEY